MVKTSVGRRKRATRRRIYKLQRWDIIKGWFTEEKFIKKEDALSALRGWARQLPGADLRVVVGSRVVAKQYNGVYSKRRGRTINPKTLTKESILRGEW